MSPSIERGVVATRRRLLPSPEHSAAAEHRRGATVDVDRWRVAGGRRRHRPTVAVGSQPHEDSGREVIEAGAFEQQLVDPGKHLLGLVDLAGQAADRVPHGDRDPGRRRALAGDVADQKPAAVVGRQHVVEVAADLDPTPGGLEDDRELEAGHGRRAGRAQAALEIAGDCVALLVELGVVEGQRGAFAELGEELEVEVVIARVAAGVEEGEGADPAAAGDQRDDRGGAVAGLVHEGAVSVGLDHPFLGRQLGEVSQDHRGAAAQHLGDRVPAVGVERIGWHGSPRGAAAASGRSAAATESPIWPSSRMKSMTQNSASCGTALATMLRAVSRRSSEASRSRVAASRKSPARRRRLEAVMSRAITEMPTSAPPASLDRRNREGDVDQGVVAAAALGLVGVEALPGPHPGEDLVGFVLEVLRHQHRDVLADRLLGAVAVEPFGGRVPGGDDAVEVFAQDRVLGPADDPGEVGVGALEISLAADVADEDGGGGARGGA